MTEAIISSSDGSSRESGKPIAIAALVVACVAAAISWYQGTTMRDAKMRGLRAYLILAELGVVCPDCGDTALTPNAAAPIKNSVLLRIENSDQTPARGVIGVINMHSEAEKAAKLPSNFAFPDDKKHSFASKSEIGRDKHRDAIVGLGPMI
jgi:hypothetical protein